MFFKLKNLLPELFNMGNEQGDWEPYFKALEKEKEKAKAKEEWFCGGCGNTDRDNRCLGCYAI